MAMQNIFLDFTVRDSRQLSGIYRHEISEESHIEWVNRAFNIAVFLCRDYCVMPAGCLIECPFVQKACAQCRPFFTHQLIVMALKRGESLQDLIVKKRNEYEGVKSEYALIFHKSSENILKEPDYALSVISRRSDVGAKIVTLWENEPDAESSKFRNIWREEIFPFGVDPSLLERLRPIPRHLREERGSAVLWAAIAPLVHQEISGDRSLMHLLHHAIFSHYSSIYLQDFSLNVLTGLPHGDTGFCLRPLDLRYDYRALRRSLAFAGVWHLLLNMSSSSLVSLRNQPGYIMFLKAFECVADVCRDSSEVGEFFSSAKLRDSAIFHSTHSLEERFGQGIDLPSYGIELCPGDINAIDARLEAIAIEALLKVEQRQEIHKSRSIPFSNPSPNHESSLAADTIIDRLEGHEIRELCEAFSSAFSRQGDLEQFVRFELNEKLSDIAYGNGREVIFQFIEWAISQGKLRQLVRAAQKFVPNNPDLLRFVTKYQDRLQL